MATTMIVEIRKGSSKKYEYNEKTRKLELDRILSVPGAMNYPEDYGFIPKTLCEGDGDPIDAFCLKRKVKEKIVDSNNSSQYITRKIKIIGVIKMIDNGERDDKLIALEINDPRLKNINSLMDVKGDLQVIEYFLSHYKDLDGGEVKIEGYGNNKEAKKILMESKKSYRKKMGSKNMEKILKN